MNKIHRLFSSWSYYSGLAVSVFALGCMIACGGGGSGTPPPPPAGPVQPTVVTLYSNGPFVTHPGGGFNGADASAVHDGLNALGFAFQATAGNKIADDFTISDSGGWFIEEFKFYAYQTASPTTPSTFTDFRVQIWNGSPDNPASQVVWGNPTTNVLTSSVWSNCYRTSSTAVATAVDRPIMVNTCRIATNLPAGTYWVEFSAAGSLSSGPWAVPITQGTDTTTGNALQYLTSNAAWAAVVDGGTTTPQGMPFLIRGYKR